MSESAKKNQPKERAERVPKKKIIILLPKKHHHGTNTNL